MTEHISAGQQPVHIFGTANQAFGDRLASAVPGIICDGTDAAFAFAAAVALRRTCQPFFLAPLIQDGLSELAHAQARTIFEIAPDAAARRAAFEALRHGHLTYEIPIPEGLVCHDFATLRTLHEMLDMSDIALYRSQTERARIEARLHAAAPFCVVAPALDPRVPSAGPARGGRRVVVWAPHVHASALAMFMYALWNLREPAVFVCDGSVSGTPHEFVPSAKAAQALHEAAVIIDTNLYDPGTALAFAGRGLGIVSAATSGAHEYIDGAVTYIAHDFASIADAVSRARAQPENRVWDIPDIDEQLHFMALESTPVLGPNAPSVTVVIATFNRRAELRSSLEAWSRQTYPNFEVLVVNDAGVSVADIVAEYPFARYMDLPENRNGVGAFNAGLRAATGEYICNIADDDTAFPDHLVRLVAALNASRLQIAHANTLIRMNTTLEDGSLATYGYESSHAAAADPTRMLFASEIPHLGLLIRKDAYASVGFLNEDFSIRYDYEAILKLSRRFDFCHVHSITTEFNYRNDASNRSSQMSNRGTEELLMIYERFTQPGSALIAERQARTVEIDRQSAAAPTYFRPGLAIEPPIPNVV